MRLRIKSESDGPMMRLISKPVPKRETSLDSDLSELEGVRENVKGVSLKKGAIHLLTSLTRYKGTKVQSTGDGLW